ncbi:MAG: alanine/glycine:cation symporter family protein [Verrucomicrobiales bacterium]
MNFPHRLRSLALVTLFLNLFAMVPMSFGDEADGTRNSFDATIDSVVGPAADIAETIVFYSVGGFPLVLVLLASTAVFLTIYFRFINLRGFKVALGTIRGKYTSPDAPGQITHFQALSAALSATVGLGNIAGVAVAIGIGGPGATLWMILIGFCGMTTKFTECTLGVLYRKVAPDGTTRGGAMYYLRDGLAEKGMPGLGKFLAVFFAIMCIAGAIGAGNMFQANQAHQQIHNSFGIFAHGYEFGIVVAILVALVIIGGIVAIARVTSFLVPFMCGIYLLAAIAVLLVNASHIPDAIGTIFTEAFSGAAAGGGIVGVLIQGIKRGVFSNEAGVGSAPIAHSAVKTDRPASEGLVALLEPFIDTVVVCTMTALVIVTSGMWNVKADTKAADTPIYAAGDASAAVTGTLAEAEKLRFTGNQVEVDVAGSDEKKITWREVTSFDDTKSGWVKEEAINLREDGIWLTSAAFSTVIGWFPYVLSIAVFLFAFSTMISWSYYAEQAVIYLFGDNKVVVIAYKLVFCGFIIVGAAASLGNVIRLADALFFCMVVPNLIGVYILLPKVKEQLNSYMEHVRSVDSSGS